MVKMPRPQSYKRFLRFSKYATKDLTLTINNLAYENTNV